MSICAPTVFCWLIFHIVLAESRPLTPNTTNLCYPCGPGFVANTNCTILPGTTQDSPPCDGRAGWCVAGAVSNCTPCGPGFYQPNSVGILCDTCGYGYYNPYDGQSECLSCEPGNFCPRGANKVQVPCGLGYYCPDWNMYRGFLCQPGTVCLSQGTINPVKCSAGFYCTGGSNPMMVCPINFYCPEGSGSATPCPWLFTSPVESYSCDPTLEFYLVVGFASCLLLVGIIFIWYEASKRIKAKIDNTVSAEITNLIPKADGPSYTGL
eukprot:TRINITY_DN12170_c0_g1_i1.p1 TRINITY_DN12170_c0_g1~~TRINITY_DN12170_c0_g1_i1.p1  ORF type:complete len:283 (+),score=10.65 TRINITY_DN12170_c0_g1_i1:53-850(+)